VSPQKTREREPKTSTQTGAGSVIPGYSILARLGRGGMGAVFKAIQLSMNRLVALKILPVTLAKDKTYIRRFLREARSAAQMNHPNLTRVYDVGSYRGVFYFSMEFVEGATLYDLIQSEGGIDVETATDIVLQAARGLRHAHSHSIVHRDIKPENIMIATDGTVKVTDMGLAKRMDTADHDITVTGQVIGTPCYMSPEQITSPKFVDERSDVYSLGATFFHMVAGRRPFMGDNSAHTMLKVVGEDPVWPRGGIPVAVLRVIKKMMAKDPARRYQSMDELVDELLYVKDRIFAPHRSRRLPLFKPYTTPAAGTHSGPAALLLEAPSRRITLLLAMAALLAVALAVLLRPVQPSEAAPAIVPDLSYEAYFSRGRKLGEEKRWEEALAHFKAAAGADPSRHAAWFNCGFCLSRLGRHEEAVKCFSTAIDLDPSAAEKYVGRGASFLELGKADEALRDFTRVARLDPQSYQGWLGIAIAHSLNRRKGNSLEALQKAVQLDPRVRYFAEAESAFDWLRDDPGYREIVSK
jgi:tetratricopeptide (TPR) repeat protein